MNEKQILQNFNEFDIIPEIWIITKCNTLKILNPYNGISKEITTIDTHIHKIAFNSTGDLYGITSTGISLIDKSTGITTKKFQIDTNVFTFSQDNNLYLIDDTYNLRTINLNTNKSTIIGSIDFTPSGDMVYMNNFLYLTSGVDEDTLIRVNPLTGKSKIIGSLNIDHVRGLVKDNQTLYGISKDFIFTIDLSNAKKGEMIPLQSNDIVYGSCKLNI